MNNQQMRVNVTGQMPPITPENAPKLAICAMFRDEAFYLKEWIEYHLMVGVERFYLYNNLSQDNYAEILDPYVKQGLVWMIHIEVEPGQLISYNHCLAINRENPNWLAFIDLDEFICPVEHDNVQDFLKDYEDYPGVVMSWLMFNTSGHILRPSGLVLENYTVCEVGGNIHVKTILRPNRVRMMRETHCAIYHEGLVPVNENKKPVIGPFSEPSVSKIRLNHYWTKSVEDYFKVKLARPRSDTAKMRTVEEFFKAERNHGTGEDRVIQRYLPRLKERLGLTELEEIPSR